MHPNIRKEIAALSAAGRHGEAIQKLNVLCRQGDGEAAYALASWSLNASNGQPFDLKKAEEFLGLAISRGWPDAFFDMAAIKSRSKSPRRFKDAFALLLVGALLGDQAAIDQLTVYLEDGVGCFSSPQAAEMIRNFVKAKN